MPMFSKIIKLTVALAAVLIFSACTFPQATDTTVIKADGSSCTVNGGGASFDGSAVKITKAGKYTLQGKLSGRLIVDAPEGEVELVFDGIDIEYPNGSPVYIAQAKKVLVTLSEGSKNSITDGEIYIYDDEQNSEPDAALFSKSDLVIDGSGTLDITSSSACGIKSKDTLVISGGKFKLNTALHSIVGRDSLTVSGGDFDITTGESALKATNTEDAALGNIEITGGTFNVNAENNGIKAENTLSVSGGNINIERSVEGFEAKHINISGGCSYITSSDDGINASTSSSTTQFEAMKFDATNAPTVNISDGVVIIDAEGDGIDSNGSASVDGGTVIVYGPTASGNSALDFETDMSINGGTLIALGAAEMLEIPHSATQNTVILTHPAVNAGESLALAGESGDILLALKAKKDTSSLIFSSPALESNASYSLYRGVELKDEGEWGLFTGAELEGTAPLLDFTVSDSVTVVGNIGNIGGFGGFGGQKPGFRDEMPPDDNGETPPNESGGRDGFFHGGPRP